MALTVLLLLLPRSPLRCNAMRCDVNIGSLLLFILAEQGSIRAECLSFFLSFFTFIPLFDETSDSRQDAT